MSKTRIPLENCKNEALSSVQIDEILPELEDQAALRVAEQLKQLDQLSLEHLAVKFG